MANSDDSKDLSDDQPDLFGADGPPPAYQPEPEKVRSRLHRILSQVRGAERMPWEPATVTLYRTIFPEMSKWLPEDEAAQLCFEFDVEMKRLDEAA